MDSPNTHRSYEDNRETEKSQLSHRSVGKNSDASFKIHPGKNKNKERSYNESVASDRARTRTRDPDHDRISDYEKNSDNYYSDEYENLSPSDRSRSLSPCSRSPSPSPRKAGRVNQVSSRPLHRKALQRAGSKPLRAGGQQRWGVHSQSLNKDSSPKDLDLVTKRVLSARLLKINEQRNELTELQLRLDQLQKENKVLRQLQHRQERALNKFEDTENEIAQLISRHNNEVHVLRERLRRAQERERATKRRLKDAEEELHRSKAALQKLRRLAEDRHLGEREELARKAAQAQGRLQDSERRIKDLERNMELSSSSFQRQLAAERKKTHEVQEEVKNLREELERVTQKLKEKERELDTKNIYANRMGRAPPKKEMDNSTKKKGLSYESPPRTSSKGVQTEDRMPSVEFPTPPPAVTDGPENAREDDYLSLKIFQGGRRSPSASIPVGTPQHTSTKELQERERTPRAVEDDWHEVERERSESEEKRQEPRMRDEKAVRPQDGKREEDRKGHGQTVVQKEEENRKRRGLSPFRVHLEPEEEKKEVDQDLNLEKMEEERRRKEQLLAKMREIDQQAQNTELLSDNAESRAAKSPPWLSETKNQHSSAFNFPEPVENLHKGLPSQGSGDSLKKLGSSGRRGLKPQTSNEDLSFGSYAPSFGRPSGRGGAANQRVDGAEEKRKDVVVRKEKSSNLMQQLFGASINADTSSKMEVLSPPPTRKPSQQNGSPFPWESSKKKESFFSSDGSKATISDKSPLQVAENRPTVRAISSFDEDIEEVTL